MSRIDELLHELAADEVALEAARNQRDRWVPEEDAEAGGLEKAPTRAAPSNTPISKKAFELIILFEVSSPAVYTKKYQRPIWPKGQSGVTIGVGYDIGYVIRSQFREDWEGVLSEEMIATLERACTVTGAAASDLTGRLQDVVISWSVAERVFRERVLPRYVGETEKALPNTQVLSPDCLGALVSLDYNRGPAFSSSKERYREMRAIKEHMAARDFTKIPGEFRAMKRLWEGDPRFAGVVKRREIEAQLFESGLVSMSMG